MTNPQHPTLPQRFCRWLLSLCGWEVETGAPATRKYIMVVYPHTSNWDFPWGYLAKTALGLKLHWMAKDSLFRGPMGWFARKLGGIPVDRRKRNKFIEQLAERFRRSEELIIAITPEGTRGHTEHWKSGFYYVAQGADVPVVLAYIDYGRKRMGLSEPFKLSGNAEADLERIRGFYQDRKGRYPQNAGTIRFAPRSAEASAEQPARGDRHIDDPGPREKPGPLA